MWNHYIKLGFCGHTTRIYLSLEREIVQGCAPGYRNRGQQRRCWTDENTEWTGMMKINEAATAATDRDHWRWILHYTNPSYGGRHWTTTTFYLGLHLGLDNSQRVSVNTTSAPLATCLCRLTQLPARNWPSVYSFFAQKWYGLLSFWALSWLRARML